MKFPLYIIFKNHGTSNILIMVNSSHYITDYVIGKDNKSYQYTWNEKDKCCLFKTTREAISFLKSHYKVKRIHNKVVNKDDCFNSNCKYFYVEK